jgi:osmoprotectant transport system substrate-binding protein
VVRKDVADMAGPDLEKTVELISAQLTDETMQELNARVDLDHEDPATVARRYLRDKGLVK